MIDASKRPTKKFESKGKNIVEYKLGMITKDRSVHKTNCTKNLFVNFNNIIMFMFISKHMLETTYTLRLGQLLKITLDLKIYVA
jgi:hypothetical protein